MKYYTIEKKKNLSGSVSISGAKNSVLPLICLSILSKEDFKLSNVPCVDDVNTLLDLLSKLGAKSTKVENGSLTISSKSINSTTAIYDIVKKMRASILVMGPLLARFGHCEISLPGGCAIGERPIDLHLKAMEALGAKINIMNGYVQVSAPNGLKGGTIVFDKITVTGCENAIMASALANGTTTIINCAREPEVVQLCEALQSAGIKIKGVGTSELVIQGNNQQLLTFNDIRVIPDRIEAGTFLTIGAISQEPLTIKNICKEHLTSVLDKLEEMGCSLSYGSNEITIVGPNKLKSVNIVTTEYPGFPTDMQAQFMAALIKAKGTSTITETLFENRFMHVAELRRIGANININGNTATIIGVENLSGTDVMATDLRASASLIIGALQASGQTSLHRVYHLERGYDAMSSKLAALGLDITIKHE
ncbi:UDP-N-acetylglucosamine 1-carboxyvinyltransferase [Providencia sp. PROV174]|uniref:UDP-N-acetylglucosamine 1-carboxyvinyltransferase n=1 Tax=Providencia sp. PROV174 TaxID=2949877 RepID=UPI002349692C|nr:UDP-N-acetylglucosamine 1-carboxyvinyltransferase [Providencia sp. PROV174]